VIAVTQHSDLKLPDKCFDSFYIKNTEMKYLNKIIFHFIKEQLISIVIKAKLEHFTLKLNYT